MCSSVGAAGCWVWNKIFKGMYSFTCFTCFKVNIGERIWFWHDAWCSRVALWAERKFGSVEDHMIRSRVFCSWNLLLRRKLNDWEIKDMGGLMKILEAYNIGDRDREDALIWMPNEESGFSVKSLYASMEQDSEHIFPDHFVWKTLALQGSHSSCGPYGDIVTPLLTTWFEGDLLRLTGASYVIKLLKLPATSLCIVL